MDTVLQGLATSDEPSIRYKARAGVLGESPRSPAMQALRAEVAASPRVRALLAERTLEGVIPRPVYQKWMGAHWVLTQLADLGYPEGDPQLKPLVDQGVQWALALSPSWIEGRARRCCSQEGNALLYALRLGFGDERCDILAQRLASYQWADGGWNCDKKPSASHASFHESLIPLRALNAYAQTSGDAAARQAADRAAEMFLERSLFRRKSTGEVIAASFTQTHYPHFWQYSFLHGLCVMVECGRIGDPRCQAALDLMESKRLDDGGWPAERRHYAGVGPQTALYKSRQTAVDWGPTSGRGRTANPWVTVEALTVLTAAERYQP
jgi:hypothetical protein